MPNTEQHEAKKLKTIGVALSQELTDHCDEMAHKRRWSRSSYIRWCIEQAKEPDSQGV